MLARLLFAAVALCLIGALPDARAGRVLHRVASSERAASGAALGPVLRLDAAGSRAAAAPGARPAQGR